MDILNFLRFLFLTTALLVLSSQMAAPQNSNIYREYIGAMSNGVKFTDVPINPNVEFHFILAFAVDYTDNPTNGIFSVFWDEDNLSPEAVSDIKQRKENVKVALALGGAKVGNNKVIFSASSIDSWVSNAVSSLTSWINRYHLDGIDIDYEDFDGASDPETFVECIGQLITTLKDNSVISFASIAPFDDDPMKSLYMSLWEKYSSVIDYVNFQFYGYNSSTTMVQQFLEYYDQQLNSYRGGKVLASFSTDDTDVNKGLTPANGFFDACKQLRDENKLHGIFGWCADTSSEYGFADETEAQELLAGGA